MTNDIWEPRVFSVSQRRRETADTFTLALELSEGAGIEYQPGQFNMLYLFGAGEVPISISGDPRDPKHLIHTIRAVGLVTQGMERLRPGDTVGVRGPFGTAWPMEAGLGGDLLVIAGGIGLAPLRPVLYHYMAHREQYGRAALLYGVRRPVDMLYRSEFGKWKKGGWEMAVTVDAPDETWMGNVGVVTTLIERAAVDPAVATVMLCGPELMMKFCVRALLARGYREDRIYVSMERNMKCAIGFCGHCQYGARFICKDGPVFPYPEIKPFLEIHEW